MGMRYHKLGEAAKRLQALPPHHRKVAIETFCRITGQDINVVMADLGL